MLGGMRAVTWTQVAQYIVLIIAYLIPVFWISNKSGFGFFPHFMLGEEVARLGDLESQFGLVKNAAADVKAAGCLLYTSPSPRDRQKSRMPSSA